MKFLKLLLIVVVLTLPSAIAVAQSTPYSTDVFSATFNGPVSIEAASRNLQNTSTTTYFNSANNKVSEAVCLRTVDHDIDVNLASLDFYANGAASKGFVQDERQYRNFNGHIGVYVDLHKIEVDKSVIRRRSWYIIVNSRTVIIAFAEAPAAQDEGGLPDWTTLTNSLVIK